MKNYKFLDVGCKTGKSFSISKNFGYDLDQGLGVDINEEHVEKFKSSGRDALVASATDLPFENNTFELVIFNHVLEHLPNEKDGKKSLDECLRVSSKYVYLALPYFDEDDYLNSLGLKTFYSDWIGHTNKVHYKKIVSEYLNNFKIKVNFIKKLENSLCEEILPISAPVDSFEYDFKKHGYKNNIIFDRDIWREFYIIINK